MAKRSLPVISLFSGGLGLDLGLEQAGFRIRAAIECNKFAAGTVHQNRPDIPSSIASLTSPDRLESQ